MGLLFIFLSMTQYDHWAFYYIACELICPIYFPLRHPWPICFPWVSSAIFSNSAFPRAFTNSFGLSWPNYLIFHHWASWAFYQTLTFFIRITLGLLWLILTFLHHILPMSLLLLSLRAPLTPFASLRLICLFYGPMIHYSCHLSLMVFYLLANSFLPMLLSFFLLLGLPKLASTNICKALFDITYTIGIPLNWFGYIYPFFKP